MNVGQIIHFHNERFFEGAVQLSWVQRRVDQAHEAAKAFVFHGPRYHGAGEAEREGVEGAYKLKDTASFVRDLLGSMYSKVEGREINPYWLVVAGYGSGKSHLALTCATLLAEPKSDAAQKIIEHISRADSDIGDVVARHVLEMVKPVLVLPLDGMAGFHLGNALSRAVFQQLLSHGVDAGAIRDLSPRFQIAEQFVERNFVFRADGFAVHLPGLDSKQICARLRENDESVYTAVDGLYVEANGHPIPIEGQESAQELIEILCSVYCGLDGPFSHVVILFDELGRYLEYASEKPQLAGDSALQQIFQGVQDNNEKVRFVGFIQYELKAYLKRFSSSDLRQLQRYITRFDAADKWYLSTNLETIFAHMIGKDEDALKLLWRHTDAEKQIRQTWQHLSASLPGFSRFPVWSDPDRFSRIIALGCWPLHPFAVWFLTRQRDLVQSRSALTFIKDVIESIANEDSQIDGRLRQVSAAELVIRNMLPELISAERETGGTIAETLQMLLEKFSGHMDMQQKMVLAGVAVVEKTRIGKQKREMANAMLCEATAIESSVLPVVLDSLSELGAVEWNDDLGQYELLSDGATRGQFQQWLRSQQAGFKADGIRDLFIRRGSADIELGNVTPDFAQSHDISTPDWFFDAQLAHTNTIGNVIQSAFQEWQQAILPKDAKGKLIYLYLHPDDDAVVAGERIQTIFNKELKRLKQLQAPIWVIGITDKNGAIAEHLVRLYLFDEKMSAGDHERFRRFISDELQRSRVVLKDLAQAAIKDRLYWVAGFSEIPVGRIRTVGLEIFNQVYPKTIPFPFDGFGSAAGGGASDAVQLARGLITRQVNVPWMQAQPKKLQNRIDAVLVQSWKALSPSGKLVEPSGSKVSTLYQWIEKKHRDDPQRTLLDSYQALISPPYGLNASSASMMLGLLLGLDSPPRRIEQAGVLVASTEWLQNAFPSQRGRYHFDESVLAESRLRFLSDDSEGRWRHLLNRWEAEQNYVQMVKLSREAAQMGADDPLPESLEGNYKYLRDRSEAAALNLLDLEARIKSWEREIEMAEQRSSIEHAIRTGDKLLKQRDEMQESQLWSENYIDECNSLCTVAKSIISREINNWIPRQICQTATQVPDFRHLVEKQVRSLDKLGFHQESKALFEQAQRSIHRVEKMQHFSLTLAQCNDYPRQSEPTDSTPVQTLRNEVTLGDELIAGIQGASAALSQAEIDAYVHAIKKRQDKLQVVQKRQKDTLGAMYAVHLESKEDIREALTKINRLREIFVGTRDENEINELAVQLERILSDMSAWETSSVSVERLKEVLTQQIEHQLATLQTFLNDKEIEPAWDLLQIYQALMSEQIDTAMRRSKEWVQPRLEMAQKISSLDRQRCAALAQELASAPDYLSIQHAENIMQLQESVKSRIIELDELNRSAIVSGWQQRYLELRDINNLDRHTTEELLQGINKPPCELRLEERVLLTPINNQLSAHLDQMSMDELLSRIEKLPEAHQRQLFERISKLINEKIVTAT